MCHMWTGCKHAHMNDHERRSAFEVLSSIGNRLATENFANRRQPVASTLFRRIGVNYRHFQLRRGCLNDVFISSAPHMLICDSDS